MFPETKNETIVMSQAMKILKAKKQKILIGFDLSFYQFHQPHWS